MTADNILTLLMLIFLQAVLGFDNLLYISIESKRVSPEKAQYVRRVGIAMAIILRIVLLFVLVKCIEQQVREKDGPWKLATVTQSLNRNGPASPTSHADVALEVDPAPDDEASGEPQKDKIYEVCVRARARVCVCVCVCVL